MTEKVIIELVKAISSLNMPADTIPEEQRNDSEFLSDTDYNVKHSIKHIRKAIEILSDNTTTGKVIDTYESQKYNENKDKEIKTLKVQFNKTYKPELIVLAETEKAYRLENHVQKFWIPKSIIKVNKEGYCILPDWFNRKNKLGNYELA